jgi:TolA-binding protein
MYPESELRPNALLQLGELLVQRADERFNVQQRASGVSTDTTSATGSTPARPDYSEAIARYEELLRSHPDFERMPTATYTLGTLYATEQRHADAARVFGLVVADTAAPQPLRAEAYFRLGDATFELAAQAAGARRRQLFADAAEAYGESTQLAEAGGDIYFLSMYKLGWSYYNQATSTNQDEYRQAVQTFDRLIEAYDQLSEEQQSRLGLRQEAIEYMAISFTQIGGAEAANRYFETRGGAPYRLQVLGRVATSLRDQGNFSQAILAYRTLLDEAPTDSGALAIQLEIIDIHRNRLLQADSAQMARLELVERFGPDSPWARANPGRVEEAQAARQTALRESGQHLLAAAQRTNDQQQFAQAAGLYERYLSEFPQADSARPVTVYLGEALFGQREFLRAGGAYSRAAYGFQDRDSLARQAAQNAIVAFDSALTRTATDRAAQDSLFLAVDRFVEAYPESETARLALQQKGRRASEVERWDAVAAAFREYARRYPDDPYTPRAERLVADALYQQGSYAEAQVQWDRAQGIARERGQTALADSISGIRTAAASNFADTLIARGEYRRAAEEVYVAMADRNPTGTGAADALRNAIETYRAADSAATAQGNQSASREAKQRAAELAERLVAQHPNYQHRTSYQLLRANYLADLGRRDEAVTALQQLVAQNPNLSGRSDAMVRIALILDSLGRDVEAAEAYEAFALAYPRDARAADAMWNAALSFAAGGDEAAAARAYGRFAQRFPNDERAGEARRAQIAALQGAGDPAAVEGTLAELCRNPTADVRELCAERSARIYYEAGARLWPEYDALELRLTGAVTAAAVNRATTPKRQLLQRMVGQFQQAIETGHPLYLSAATYWAGLGQWEYGTYLRDVQLPSSLSESDREQARQAAGQQADEFFAQARNSWQTLIEKADQENIRNEWVDRARNALSGDVRVPPVPSGGEGSTTDGGSE